MTTALEDLEHCQAYVDDAALFPDQFKRGVVARDAKGYAAARQTFANLVLTATALSANIEFRIDDPRCAMHDALKQALAKAGTP